LVVSDNSNQLCVTETINNLQDLIGKLSFSDFNIGTAFSDFQKILAGAANLACTGCTKAAFRLASQLSLLSQFPSAEPQATQQIDALCGANFIGWPLQYHDLTVASDLSSENSTSDDQDGVSQTAINEQFTTKKSNSALSLPTSKMAGAAMFFFFSAFTLLG
jgi:hypothetical protein